MWKKGKNQISLLLSFSSVVFMGYMKSHGKAWLFLCFIRAQIYRIHRYNVPQISLTNKSRDKDCVQNPNLLLNL